MKKFKVYYRRQIGRNFSLTTSVIEAKDMADAMTKLKDFKGVVKVVEVKIL